MTPTTRERVVEAYLKKRVNAAGGVIRKLRWIARRGAPDRLVALPGGRLYLIELKRPGGRMSESQSKERAAFREVGVEVYLLDSISSVENWCRGVGI